MSLPAACPACMFGDHSRHDPTWNIREGLIGGNSCDCPGDCAEQTSEHAEGFATWLKGGRPDELP